MSALIILGNDPDGEREVDEQVHSNEDENWSQHILRSQLVEVVSEENSNNHPYVDSHHQEN